MLIYDNLFCRISQSYCIKLYCWIHTWKREDIISLSKVCLIFNFRSLVITGRTFGKVGKIHSNVAFNFFCPLEKGGEINWIVCYTMCTYLPEHFYMDLDFPRARFTLLPLKLCHKPNVTRYLRLVFKNQNYQYSCVSIFQIENEKDCTFMLVGV